MQAGATEHMRRDEPLTAIIIDDEPLARDCIRVALDRVGDVRIVAECGDGGTAIAAIERHGPDLVFLDVQMPDVDGFGVVERIGIDNMPAVVFVTAYDAHALRAFEVNALDYVLKPFDDARLAGAVERARARLRLERESDFGRRLAALLSMVRAPGSAGPASPLADEGYVTRLTVRTDDRVHLVPVRDVDWFEGAGNYVRLHVGTKELRIRLSLTALLARLDPAQFVRVHRSTIVNVERIREVQPWFGGDYLIILTGGQQLRVSRTYAPQLLRPMQ